MLSFVSLLKAKCTKNTKWDWFPLLSAPSQLAKKKEKKKLMILLMTLSRHISPATTPATAAANHRHLLNTVTGLTLNENENRIPETKGCISHQGEKTKAGTQERLAKISQGWAWKAKYRTPSPAA